MTSLNITDMTETYITVNDVKLNKSFNKSRNDRRLRMACLR